jgi:hypothetical protein
MENNLREWKKFVEDCGEINHIDTGEHDHEGSMARGELYHIAKDAIKLIKFIEKGENLEGWVASKITKAKEGISAVADYIESEKTVNNNDSPEEYTKVPEELPTKENSKWTSMNKYGIYTTKAKDGDFNVWQNDKHLGSFKTIQDVDDYLKNYLDHSE